MTPLALLAAAPLLFSAPIPVSGAPASGTDDLNNPALVALLEGVEARVNDLATVAEESYKAWACGSDPAGHPIDDCYVDMCRDRLASEQCSSGKTYGGCGGGDDRVLDFTKSAILSKVDPTTATPDLRERIEGTFRWSSALDPTFKTNADANDQLSWQYIGTPDGVFRSFPGHGAEQCNDYDPRVRSWYVAATSGPKDVVITIDVSGSMDTQNRLELAKEAVIAVLNTLDQKDSFAVITFNDRAKQLCGEAMVELDTRSGTKTEEVDIACSNELAKATVANRAAMVELVKGITSGGGTKFNEAFATSFNVIRNSLETSTGCATPAILFLTDGEDSSVDIAKIEVGRAQLTDVGKLPTIFTFSLGSGADIEHVRQIACDTDGVWSPVADGGDLRSQMAHYYDYFAQLHANPSSKVTWVEEYHDASGAGWMTTASKAVYDDSTSPPTLIGVVSVDVLISTLEEAAKTAGTDLLKALAERNTECIELAADPCALEKIRGKDYGAARSEAVSSNSLLLSSDLNTEELQSRRLCLDESAASCGAAGVTTCGKVGQAPGFMVGTGSGDGPDGATVPPPPGATTTGTSTAYSPVHLRVLTAKCTEPRDDYDQVCGGGECSTHSGDGRMAWYLMLIIALVVICVCMVVVCCIEKVNESKSSGDADDTVVAAFENPMYHDAPNQGGQDPPAYGI